MTTVNALTFVAAVFVVYRVSFMVAREDGPFDLFARLRAAVGQRNWVGRGLHCVLCVSFWVALPVGWWVMAGDLLHASAFPDAYLHGAFVWLAIAGGVLFIHKFVEPG